MAPHWNAAGMEIVNLLTLYIFWHIHLTSSWSVNNFLMTGPKAFLTYANSVQVGARMGIHECKHQFAWEKWNCPEKTLQLSTHIGLRSATKETSFLHAISAAGVMYTLTKNCSMGDFENCGCDDSRIGQAGGKGWIWGGCSDNVEFGEKISKHFVDALEGGHDSRAAVNLHNNEAGRLAVKATMRKACKCHGVSGSCSIQTCWMQLADFREVGNYLKMKHQRAMKLELDKKPAKAGNSAVNRGIIAHTLRRIAKTELIYLEDSPNYCVKNQSLGVQGTEGRECTKGDKNFSQKEKKSCRSLCNECGFRVVQKRVEVVTSCNCKFHWCCTVRCEKCMQVVTKYYCARREGGKRHNNKTKRRDRAQRH
uniref:Protein Wnt n=1 Tax=Oryzias sinensis TaxID=183150 RepID=A0A8C7VAF9_9TELE